MEIRPLHPLARYLNERGVGIARAAALLGVSERFLRAVFAGRRRFAWWRESEVARDLGFETRELFPR
jgi:hypothetical protein